MGHELPLVDYTLVVLLIVLLLHKKLQMVGNFLVCFVSLHFYMVFIVLVIVDSIIGVLLNISITRASGVTVFNVLKECSQTHIVLPEFVHKRLWNLRLTHTHKSC